MLQMVVVTIDGTRWQSQQATLEAITSELKGDTREQREAAEFTYKTFFYGDAVAELKRLTLVDESGDEIVFNPKHIMALWFTSDTAGEVSALKSHLMNVARIVE